MALLHSDTEFGKEINIGPALSRSGRRWEYRGTDCSQHANSRGACMSTTFILMLRRMGLKVLISRYHVVDEEE